MSEAAPLESAYFDALELARATLNAPTPLRSRSGRRYTRLAARRTHEQGSPAALVELTNDDDLALARVTCTALALPDLMLLAADANGGALPGEVHVVAASFDGAHDWIAGFARRYGSTFTLHRAHLDEGDRAWRLRLAPSGTIAPPMTNPPDRRLTRLY